MKPDLHASGDFLARLLSLAIGLAATVGARDHPFGMAMRMGSGYLSTEFGGTLVLSGVFLMAREP